MESEMEGIVADPVKQRRKGGRPSRRAQTAALLQTAEGQAILSAAVEAATARLMSELGHERSAANTQPVDGDRRFARELAVAIGEMSDQGAKLKKVSPAEMERRKNARTRMEQLLVEARAEGVVPEYELNRAVYLDEVLVPPTYIDRNHVTRRTQIAWPHVPNEGMSPSNPVAKNIFHAFMESIGGATQNINRAPATPEPVSAADESGLRVLHKDSVKQAPQVGKPRHNDLQIIGRNMPGVVEETRVLGTIAAPARQIS